MSHDDISGIWHCRYWYPSNEHEGEDVSEYEVEIHQKGNRLIMTSLPTKNGSYITVRLSIDGHLATGAWQESTAPNGPFEGMVYSGAMQLLVDEGKRRMAGKWVGNGREKLNDGSYEERIYTGNWELVRK